MRFFRMDEQAAHFDWNRAGPPRPKNGARSVTLLDETLRDGIQNASVVDPSIECKIEFLHAAHALGVEVVNAGYPASSRRSSEHARAICREIAGGRLRIRPAAAARTLISDIEPILEIRERTGVELEAYVFIGSSPIRQLAEAWDIESLTAMSTLAIDFAVKRGLSVCFVTEDTTRSRPETLWTLWQNAIDHGATRLCLADTVGHATPDGARSLVGFTRSMLASAGVNHVALDWHGHNDRGFALHNAIAALEAGVDRLHATALGIGERTGNVPMELLLRNLVLLGEMVSVESAALERYSSLAGGFLRSSPASGRAGLARPPGRSGLA